MPGFIKDRRSKSLHFRSDDPVHGNFSRGKPVQCGKIPKTTEQIIVDGELVNFVDDTIPERIGSVLLAGLKFAKNGRTFDCVSFAAFMSITPSSLSQEIDRILSLNQSSRNFSFLEVTDTSSPVAVDDTTTSRPLNLSPAYENPERLHFLHTVYPAHTTAGAMYVHKLGDKGPLCLSGLSSALEMFKCDVAYPMTHLTVNE